MHEHEISAGLLQRQHFIFIHLNIFGKLDEIPGMKNKLP